VFWILGEFVDGFEELSSLGPCVSFFGFTRLTEADPVYQKCVETARFMGEAGFGIIDTISGSVTSLAIAWLLQAVNLADLKKSGRRMVGAFAIAVVGTALGAFVGALIFAGRFEAETWKLPGL